MEANKDYWGGAPAIDEVVFRIYSDQEGMKLAMESGEIDFADALTPEVFNQLKGQPNIDTLVATPSSYTNLAYNFKGTANPALRELTVRQAIAHAIDKQTLVDRVLLGNGSAGDSVLQPIYSRWYEPINGTDLEYKYDPDEARRLLGEAGWTDTNGDGLVEKDGKTLDFELLAISDLTTSVPLAKLMVGSRATRKPPRQRRG